MKQYGIHLNKLQGLWEWEELGSILPELQVASRVGCCAEGWQQYEELTHKPVVDFTASDICCLRLHCVCVYGTHTDNSAVNGVAANVICINRKYKPLCKKKMDLE